MTSVSGTTTTVSTGAKFASGTKAVRINTHTLTGAAAPDPLPSFTTPTTLPAATPIPTTYPGYDGSSNYLPGVSASTYYDVDGTTVVSKPSWIKDVQLGITATSASSSCATFGGSGNADVNGYYRVSEINCGSAALGTGSSLTDPVFVRIILDRDSNYIGTAENLVLQVEYQASALHLNSDGADNAYPENNLDQFWKIMWNSTLSSGTLSNPFSVFIPPNYGACLTSGSQITGAPGNCEWTSGYRGAPITTRQFMIPLSAYPTMKVITLTRVKGRINSTDIYPVGAGGGNVNYVSDFLTAATTTDCDSDSPLCLGVVIRSITLLRM